jgi:hypothetical protein
MKVIKLQELKRMVRCLRAGGAAANLQESLDNGDLKPEHFSVQDLFVALHESGEELLREINTRRSGGRSLLEAVQGVDTQAFSSIIGQIVFNKIKEAYADPVFLWPDLCETKNTQFLDGERIPGWESGAPCALAA